MDRRLDFNKRDKTGQIIHPGDVCVRLMKDDIELCIYKGDTKGNGSTGEFGRFQTPDAIRSIKYTSVIFAFDPLSERRNRSEQAISIIRKYYEGE